MDQNQINSLLKLLIRFPHPNYPTGVSTMEAFWRTLIKDTFRDGPASGEAQNAFRYLVSERVGMLEDYPIILEEQGEEINLEEHSTLLTQTKASIDHLSMTYPNNQVIPDWDAIHEIIESGMQDPNSPEKIALDRNFDSISESFRVAYACRRLFRTRGNYLGIAAQSLQEGDAVWVLAGAAVPFVLRPLKNREWKVVGEAYVHGIMSGEVLRDFSLQSEQIQLV
jgi:hypothetical protein